MKWKNFYSRVDKDYVLVDFSSLHRNARTNVEPPYTNEELKKIFYFDYLYIKFLQENNLTTHKLIEKEEDMESLTLKFGDLNEEGVFFDRNMSKFLDLKDFNVDPHGRVEKILVKGLREMRDLHKKGEIKYGLYEEEVKK
jgi:hypothetical protein